MKVVYLLFLKSLKMIARIDTINNYILKRVFQLIQKTNQFTTTIKRYSQNKIKEINSNKNLSKEQKEQQISEARKAGNKLQYLHEYNTAVKQLSRTAITCSFYLISPYFLTK